MSSYSRITDDEMRYYQFKARQQFLLKREDHDWNEFSQKYKCTCCSCQPINLNPQAPQKDVGVQAAPKSLPKFDHQRIVKRVQEKPLSDSLNDIRTKLEQINLAVSGVKLIQPKDQKKIIESVSVDNGLLTNKSTINNFNEQRQNFIRNSILTSWQRLHSTALQKPAKPQSSSSMKNKSFFLPPVLQKQRLIARNAYLESLVNKPKVAERAKPKSLHIKIKNPPKKNNKITSSQSIPFNVRRKKVDPTLKSKEEKTLIQSEISSNKDENIEKVVDGILDDLVGEEIIALNRIKHMKLERQPSNVPTAKDSSRGATKKEVSLREVSSDIRAKIKQIPFFNLSDKSRNNEKSSLEYSPQCQPENIEGLSRTRQYFTTANEAESNVRFDLPSAVDSKADSHLRVKAEAKQFRIMRADPKLAKKVTRQRKLYFHYLEKVSRNRDNNFDPVALTNMVAESLVDDCISDICKELSEVPSSLIMDIYNQEFTLTL